MKLALAAAASLALGASASITPPQIALGDSLPKHPSALVNLIEKVKSLAGAELTDSVSKAWSEVASLFPEDAVYAIQSKVSGYQPKPAKKRPDGHWDIVVDGREKMRSLGKKVDGAEKLKDAKLRIKKPNGLGIDEDVKQYSGYLDVEGDKHFFFCESLPIF